LEFVSDSNRKMEILTKPYIILNAAMTADGKIDTITRRGAKISSEADWSRVDELRAAVDAVMVGGKTLLNEDPRLTVKSPELRRKRLEAGKSENPLKVGIVTDARISAKARFLNDGPAEVVIFTTSQASSETLHLLKETGVRVVLAGDELVDLPQAMHQLKTFGVDRLLLEGGGTLNASMFAEELIDEVQVYLAPVIFAGADAPTLADGAGFGVREAVPLALENIKILPNGGVLLTYLAKYKGE